MAPPSAALPSLNKLKKSPAFLVQLLGRFQHKHEVRVRLENRVKENKNPACGRWTCGARTLFTGAPSVRAELLQT